MFFESVAELLVMDGHGIYVWSVYFLSVVVLAALLIAPLLRTRGIASELRGQIRRELAVDPASQSDSGME